MEQVWQMIEEKKLLVPGDYVLVGVSGGPDSVALLHLLWTYGKNKNIKLHIVHLNHQLRGKEADEETAYVQKLASQMDLPCSIFSVPVATFAQENGMSFEQAGHELRFRCFQQVAEKTGATKLALGHHSGDKVETMLLNLLRGCGPEGLTAMPMQEGWIIRPLLMVDKKQLVNYCEQQKLVYYQDATNEETDCLRNKIRLELLPLLEHEYNPQIKNHLLQLAEISQVEQETLEQATIRLWEEHGEMKTGQAVFPLDVFREQSQGMQRRLLRFIYTLLKGDNHGLSYRLIESMCHCANSDKGEKQLNLAGKLVFRKSYHYIALQFVQAGPEKNLSYSYNWSLVEDLLVGEKNYLFSCQVEESLVARTENCWTAVVDANCLPPNLVVRTRRAGDYLQLVGMTARKKLKDFLIDRKIPASERDSLPLIVAGEEIIWIPGYFLAESVRVTEKTEKKAYLCCQNIDY